MHPPFCSGRGLNLLPNFQKGGEGLDSISIFREGLLVKMAVSFFRGGRSSYIKNILKYEIFTDKKKFINKNDLFPIITKNLILEILTKNLVALKTWDQIKDEKF